MRRSPRVDMFEIHLFITYSILCLIIFISYLLSIHLLPGVFTAVNSRHYALYFMGLLALQYGNVV